MKVKASQQEGFVLLIIPEDITFQNCKSLKAQIEKALQVFPDKWMVLDFKKVDFINSSGIGILVDALKTLRKREGGLFITRCGGPVRRLFEKTRLHEDIKLVKDEEAVKTAIASPDTWD